MKKDVNAQNNVNAQNVVQQNQMATNTTVNIAMDKESVKRYAGMLAGVLLVISLFVTYYSVTLFNSTSKVELWDAGDLFKIVYLLLAFIPIITFFLQKGKHLSYLTVGYVLAFAFNTMALDDIDYRLGFWLVIISSIILLVILVMDEIAMFKDMFASIPKIQMNPTVETPQQPATEFCPHCGQPKRNNKDQFCPSCGKKYK